MIRIHLPLICLFAILAASCHLRLAPQTDPFYQAVLDCDPKHPATVYAVGHSLMQQGRFDEATPFFQTLTKIEPDQPRGWLGMGQCALEQHRFKQACSAFAQALDLEPSPEAQIGLASALLLSGDTAGAQGQALQAKKKWGESATLFRLGGDIAYLLEHYEAAHEAYLQSLELNTRQPALRQRLQDLEDFLTSAR